MKRPQQTWCLVRQLTLWLLVLCACQRFLHPAAGATLDERVAKLEAAQSGINAGDNAWVLTSAALVLMMTAPGLALFYGGLVRSKNVLGTMMHSMFLMGFMTLL